MPGNSLPLLWKCCVCFDPGPHPTISLPCPCALPLCTQRGLDTLWGEASKLSLFGSASQIFDLVSDSFLYSLFYYAQLAEATSSIHPSGQHPWSCSLAEMEQLMHLLPLQRAQVQSSRAPMLSSSHATVAPSIGSDALSVLLGHLHMRGRHTNTQIKRKKIEERLRALIHLNLLWTIGTGGWSFTLSCGLSTAPDYAIRFRHYSFLQENPRAWVSDFS